MTRLEKISNTDLAVKIVLFAGLAAAGAFLVYQLKVLIVCLIVALTLASAMAPLVKVGEKCNIPRCVSVVALYLIALVSYVVLAASLAGPIHEQWNKLNENLPAYLSGLQRWYQSALHMAGNHSDVLAINVDDMRTLGLRLFHQTLDMTAGLFGLLLNGILTLFLAAYFVVEADNIWEAIVKWLPPSTRRQIVPLILPISARLGGYVRGQLLIALSVAAFLVIGLSILGVKYALVLGVLAGLLNVIPYIGSFIVFVFAALVAFNQAPLLALGTLVLYATEQWVESTVLTPMLLSREVVLHPLVVLISIIVGASLMGVLGALISVPIASVTMFLMEEFYLKRFVGNIEETSAGSINAPAAKTTEAS